MDGFIPKLANNDCITFICESPLDVTLVLINTDREKALQELRAIPEESMVEMLEQASEQLPMGLFKNDGGAELPDVGAITSYIVINAAKAKQKGISQDAVLAHERQHAENSLYLRTALERHEQKSQSIRAIADTVENWVDNIQRESSLSPQERSELLTLRLSGIANLVDTLSAQIMDTTVEVLIKEELLAFYAGGEETHKIRDALPAYILDLRSVFARVFILLDKYAKGLPNTILQGAHIDRSSISARDFGDTFACLGIFSTEGEHDDPLARMRKEVSSRLEAFDRMSEQAIQDGTAFLDEMTAYERTHQTRIAEKIFPMLISQPLPRWRSIFQKYLEEPL